MVADEARALLIAELAKYRGRPYEELVAFIGDEDHPAFEVKAPSGAEYWIEVEVFEDSKEVLRVRAAICGGGIEYQVPVCDDFLKRADGSFVGE
jgi:hypothetical protein